PICTTHLPSTMTGEAAVSNGGVPLVSFRQATLPLAASRQETMPLTPRVQTLPSATAGEARGPSCPPPMARPARALYLSDHTSLPSLALRHRITSSPPLRAKTYSLSPTSTGVASASPTSTFHCCLSSLGHVLGSVNPVTLLLRSGPRHWGQSCAKTQMA